MKCVYWCLSVIIFGNNIMSIRIYTKLNLICSTVFRWSVCHSHPEVQLLRSILSQQMYKAFLMVHCGGHKCAMADHNVHYSIKKYTSVYLFNFFLCFINHQSTSMAILMWMSYHHAHHICPIRYVNSPVCHKFYHYHIDSCLTIPLFCNVMI